MPAEVIRSIASGAGSSFEASNALERYREGQHSSYSAHEDAMTSPSRTHHRHHRHHHDHHYAHEESRHRRDGTGHGHSHSYSNITIFNSIGSVTVIDTETRGGHRTVIEIRD